MVVIDLDGLTKAILDRGFNINKGVKKWRGQINSMNALLNCFDIDYRNSLFNHNQFHVRNGSVDWKDALNKSKFSYRNIHMNLGNIRWFSTKTTIETLNKDYMDRLKNLLKLILKFIYI